MLSVLSLALVTAISIGATLAYLQDDDSDINVMTLGNVYIEQYEYERVVENNAWVSTGEVDNYGYTPDKIQEFTQAKPLLPAVFADSAIKYDDRSSGNHQQSWGQIGAPGSNQLFDDSVKNVQDKFVFVKNTGKTDAYVRTVIAFEQGEIEATNFANIVKLNNDGDHWEWNWIWNVNIDNNTYAVAEIVYKGASSNPNGVLAAGKVSYVNLTQVYMTPEATNEDVEAIDGNANGTYDILVLSQAVQTAGFANAQTALNTAFGDVNATNVAEWFATIAP